MAYSMVILQLFNPLLVSDCCQTLYQTEYVNLDIRLNYPFLSLSIDSVLEVVSALLMEQRIVFVSTSYTLLTYNMEVCWCAYGGK